VHVAPRRPLGRHLDRHAGGEGDLGVLGEFGADPDRGIPGADHDDAPPGERAWLAIVAGVQDGAGERGQVLNSCVAVPFLPTVDGEFVSPIGADGSPVLRQAPVVRPAGHNGRCISPLNPGAAILEWFPIGPPRPGGLL
jgi:hypothetical protein